MNAQRSNSKTTRSLFIDAKDVFSELNFALGAAVLVSTMTITATAAAQNDVIRHLYETSATIPTNVAGIRTFPAPPEGFDPFQASDEELATYGIPPRPDSVSDPEGYRHWARLAPLMSDPHARWYGELKPRIGRSNLAHAAVTEDSASAATFSSTKATGPNWSGVVNTLSETKWSKKKSFQIAEGEFAVPWPQEAFSGTGGNICDGDTDQASFWVGLGGLSVTGFDLGKQNNILQSGVDIAANCSEQTEYAWIEWFPAASGQVFNVNPGDDIYVDVVNTSATKGYFFIMDNTSRVAAGFDVTAPSNVQLVGNEAEYIVERPSGDSNTPNNYYPLANYVWSFWAYAKSQDFTGAYHYPSDSDSGTIRLSMTDDSGKTIISKPDLINGQQMFLQDENCALMKGCTP
jgi:hypothetical protein